MNLRALFILIIVSVTIVCGAGVSFSLIHDLSEFWRNQTDQRIIESRERFTSRVNQIVATANAASSIVSKNALVARYFSMPEAERYILLSPALTRYLNAILDAFPLFQEVSLIIEDGFEEARAANQVLNKNEIARSELLTQAWGDPSASYFGFEFNEDFDRYSLNLYRAISMIDRTQSTRKKEVKAVVKFSIGTDYFSLINRGHVSSESIFMVIHDGSGTVVMGDDDRLPREVADWLNNPSTPEAEFFKDLDVFAQSQVLFDNWTLLIGVSSQDAFKAIHRISIRGLMIQLVSLFFLAFGVYLMLSRLVVNPLGELVEASSRFSETGKIPIFESRHGELGQLQNAFMKMCATLTRQTRSLEDKVYIDGLTGLPNRNALRELISISTQVADRDKNKVALLFIDLDGFKQVNDVLGHDAGDVLLQKVSQRLSALLRLGDAIGRLRSSQHRVDELAGREQSVVRLGGDEFTVILQGVNTKGSVEVVAHKILHMFEKPYLCHDKEVFVGASIGIALYPDDAREQSDLLKYADIAMYRSKKLGKMRSTFFSPDMFHQTSARLNIENILHGALSAGEFSTAYQAKVDPMTQSVVGFEALARLNSSAIGRVSPGDFIPVAEDIGIINNIAFLVITEACNQIHHLKSSLGRDFTMAINMSPSQVCDRQFCMALSGIVSQSGIPPTLIEFEITENSLIENEASAEENIKKLKSLGYTVALDDFGAGYSSLGHLKRYRFDTLKIDQMFFKNIELDEFGRDVLGGIVYLANALNMTIVAEGVETSAQLQLVQDHKIHLVQGYVFSKPVESDQLIKEIDRIESI